MLSLLRHSGILSAAPNTRLYGFISCSKTQRDKCRLDVYSVLVWTIKHTELQETAAMTRRAIKDLRCEATGIWV